VRVPLFLLPQLSLSLTHNDTNVTQQHALVTISKSGICFTIEKDNLLQAKGYTKSNMFESYEMGRETVEFTIDIDLLVQCLTVFGMQAHLSMSYEGQGLPLNLL